MNTELAFYHLCKRYPGGVSAVAALLVMSPHVLQKKLSPSCSTHHLMVSEAEAITELTGDPSGAIALATAAGLACVPMPECQATTTLMKGMSEIGREFSELLNEFNEAVKDNRVSPNECDRFEREAIQLFAQCMSELKCMRQLAGERSPVVPIRSAG